MSAVLLLAALASVPWSARPAAATAPALSRSRAGTASDGAVLVLVRRLTWGQAAAVARARGRRGLGGRRPGRGRADARGQPGRDLRWPAADPRAGRAQPGGRRAAGARLQRRAAPGNPPPGRRAARARAG